MEKNRHDGSSFDEFLKEDEIYEECSAEALERVIAWQKEVPISKSKD